MSEHYDTTLDRMRVVLRVTKLGIFDSVADILAASGAFSITEIIEIGPDAAALERVAA